MHVHKYMKAVPGEYCRVMQMVETQLVVLDINLT